jgi:NitT/TauT family transport system permease protein
LSVDQVILDRLRILNASPMQVFLRVRLPYALPYIFSAQEITGSSSILVAVVAEYLLSSSGLGYVLSRAQAQYRGDQVFAVALIAALLSFGIYAVIHMLARRLDWQAETPAPRGT